MVPYENNLENARRILANLGQDIDVVVGVFDEVMLNLRRCAGFEISRKPLCCAVSIYHPLCGRAAGRSVEEPPPGESGGL